jgi:hypothetical protein
MPEAHFMGKEYSKCIQTRYMDYEVYGSNYTYFTYINNADA